jgi:nitrogen fixation NifU-like protein
MDREARIALLVDHAQRPRHAGPLADADVRVPGGNPGCGDLITVYLKVEPGGDRLAAASFEGAGCTISQGSTSLLLNRLNKDHPTLGELLDSSYDEMIDFLGRDVVGSRLSCATLALGTIKAGVRRLLTDRRLRAAGKSEEEIRRLRSALEEYAHPASGVPRAAGAEDA